MKPTRWARTFSRMKTRTVITSLLSISLLLPLPSCTPAGPDTKEPPKQEIEEPDTEDGQDDDKNEISMKMIVGEYTFDVEYVDNNTAEAFKKMLPVTLKMDELNGNEKYCYIDSSLPTALSTPGTINAGDIMLFGSNCIVVFYETFKTSYSYTRIGKVKDTASLKKALGSGDVTIKFE